MLFLCSDRDVFANFGKHLRGDAEERPETGTWFLFHISCFRYQSLFISIVFIIFLPVLNFFRICPPRYLFQMAFFQITIYTLLFLWKFLSLFLNFLLVFCHMTLYLLDNLCWRQRLRSSTPRWKMFWLSCFSDVRSRSRVLRRAISFRRSSMSSALRVCTAK